MLLSASALAFVSQLHAWLLFFSNERGVAPARSPYSSTPEFFLGSGARGLLREQDQMSARPRSPKIEFVRISFAGSASSLVDSAPSLVSASALAIVSERAVGPGSRPS